MLRTFSRRFLPNPFDWMLSRCAKRGGRKILLGWNRGLGDLALGLYAMIVRIREKIPDAEISFLTRENLREGFSLLEGVKVLIAPNWRRGKKVDVYETLQRLEIDPKGYDLIIPEPSPSDWVIWQRGKLVPRLKWDLANDRLFERFGLCEEFTYIGVQVVAETQYGLWRNWPVSYWEELFARLEKWPSVRVLLFGFGDQPRFDFPNVIDLRGKTTLFELLSIVKHRCARMILPDSGILSMVYYLDASFPLHLISLWADPNHGILKQAVASPNPELIHTPLIGLHRNLTSVTCEQVEQVLFPQKPLSRCVSYEAVKPEPLSGCGAVLLAGGLGSRLGIAGPKGMFEVEGKSLFEWVVEKVPKEGYPIAVMTSPLNHKETLAFFERHEFFGREIYFFEQSMHPVLDKEKRPMQLIDGRSALAPDGNGSVFASMKRSGICSLFAKKGIQTVAVVPVENRLADPADLYLLSHHRQTGAQATLKCVSRLSPQEAMGALIEREGRIEIVEYTQLSAGVDYRFSYTGMMALGLSFIEQMASVELPLHWVWKQFPVWGQEVWGWKAERYIFDALAFAKKIEALEFPRAICYAPIKGRGAPQDIHRG